MSKEDFPKSVISPNGQWALIISYQEGWGGYTLKYSWEVVKSISDSSGGAKQLKMTRDDPTTSNRSEPQFFYLMANFADGLLEGYDMVYWDDEQPASLLFESTEEVYWNSHRFASR